MDLFEAGYSKPGDQNSASKDPAAAWTLVAIESRVLARALRDGRLTERQMAELDLRLPDERRASLRLVHLEHILKLTLETQLGSAVESGAISSAGAADVYGGRTALSRFNMLRFKRLDSDLDRWCRTSVLKISALCDAFSDYLEEQMQVVFKDEPGGWAASHIAFSSDPVMRLSVMKNALENVRLCLPDEHYAGFVEEAISAEDGIGGGFSARAFCGKYLARLPADYKIVLPVAERMSTLLPPARALEWLDGKQRVIGKHEGDCDLGWGVINPEATLAGSSEIQLDFLDVLPAWATDLSDRLSSVWLALAGHLRGRAELSPELAGLIQYAPPDNSLRGLRHQLSSSPQGRGLPEAFCSYAVNLIALLPKTQVSEAAEELLWEDFDTEREVGRFLQELEEMDQDPEVIRVRGWMQHIAQAVGTMQMLGLAVSEGCFRFSDMRLGFRPGGGDGPLVRWNDSPDALFQALLTCEVLADHFRGWLFYGEVLRKYLRTSRGECRNPEEAVRALELENLARLLRSSARGSDADSWPHLNDELLEAETERLVLDGRLTPKAAADISACPAAERREHLTLRANGTGLDLKQWVF